MAGVLHVQLGRPQCVGSFHDWIHGRWSDYSKSHGGYGRLRFCDAMGTLRPFFIRTMLLCMPHRARFDQVQLLLNTRLSVLGLYLTWQHCLWCYYKLLMCHDRLSFLEVATNFTSSPRLACLQGAISRLPTTKCSQKVTTGILARRMRRLTISLWTTTWAWLPTVRIGVMILVVVAILAMKLTWYDYDLAWYCNEISKSTLMLETADEVYRTSSSNGAALGIARNCRWGITYNSSYYITCVSCTHAWCVSFGLDMTPFYSALLADRVPFFMVSEICYLLKYFSSYRKSLQL